MTISLSNPNKDSKLANLISTNSNTQQSIQPKTTAQQKDSFEKTTAPQPRLVEGNIVPVSNSNKKQIAINTNQIKQFAMSILALIIASVATNSILKSRAMQKAASANASKQFANLWDNLENAIKLEDMALPKELNEVLHKVIKCIENPKAIKERGGDGIKTILLYGPPGTGKTTFAKAIAKHFPDSQFASLDVTNLGSKYVGETEKNIQAAVTEICKRAQENPDKKFFVFIDEIDSVIMVDDGSLKKHSNDVLNEFKRCFTERLGKHNNIITIGATNVPINPDTGITFDGKRLDKPMLDRFQEKILVDRPSWEQIKEALFNHYKDRTQVGEVFHDKTSEKITELCKALAKKEHEVSFRTLASIFNDAATRGENMEAKLDLQDIFNVLKSKAQELHFSPQELQELAEKLGVTP